MIPGYTYLGDIPQNSDVVFHFNTRHPTTGVLTTLGGAPTAACYINNGGAVAGVGIYPDWDGRVGFNLIAFFAATASGYTAGKYCSVVLTAGTVGGVSVAGTVVGGFSVEARYHGNFATAAALATVQADTDNIQTRLPAALVNGRIDSNVGWMEANTMTSTALATDFVAEITIGLATAAAVAAVQADTDNIQTRLPAALISGRMDSHVGAMNANTLTASALATDAVAEIQLGLATEGNLDSVNNKVANIQTRLPTALIGGRMDSIVGAMAPDTLTASALAADAVTEIQSGITVDVSGLATATALAAVQADTDDIQSRLPLALEGGRMNSVVNDMPQGIIDHINQGMATQAQVAGIQADTDNIQLRLPAALVLGRMDSSVGAMAPDTLTASALAADAVAEIAAAMDAIATATEIADAILRRNVAGGSDGVRTVSEALYALRNKTEIVAGLMKVYQTDDATVAFQGPVTTAPGDPLTSFDPA